MYSSHSTRPLTESLILMKHPFLEDLVSKPSGPIEFFNKANAVAWEAVISGGSLVYQCDLLLCVFISHWLCACEVSIPYTLLSQAIW